ncbi:NAD(P)H-binding protein [Hymenobacter sp. BT491]|uniref:NmrA family NAD(P)-binding protein n=1 Tax=Hymenobacter sp. BT491 TaxID=2766779 RepID=UPI001653AB1B|nr:NAD(P)H-binding protein [Hymenobacter sp. BT491]MBC6992037.1 NAD(P)H-binding protein [Hymenobacter sp. BT491]
MKIIVTGSLGHISEPLTKELVAKGHAVTVISSKAERQAAIEALGATAAIGSLEDASFLAATFAGAEAVYAMVPPNMAAPDVLAYYRNVGHSYAQALEQAGVQRVVHLSSWGADLDRGTGFILGSHEVEGLLDKLPNVALTHLRAGSFYYNLFGFVGMIKGMGLIGSNYGGDDKIVWAHPQDIAAAAAEELTRAATTGTTVRYVASDERTATETAQALGAAIGKPDLQWLTFSDEQTQQGLEQAGIPAHIAANYVELGASIHNGTLRQDYDRHQPHVMGTVKVEDFAREFAAAF